MTAEIIKNLVPYETHNFSIETLKIQSTALKNNPLKDSPVRFNPVLVPRAATKSLPVILVLGGFTGNAPFYFNAKFNEKNAVQILDKAMGEGQAPEAVYVFVDALTTWGGSQFINSSATGNYEDYLVDELFPEIKKHFAVSNNASHWCVMGGSSGGYGAINLASKYPEWFGYCAAIAPDCFFEASLLPELYHALPLWEKYQQSGHKALEELRNGKLMKNRNWHTLLNCFGMSACYSPLGHDGNFQYPLNTMTGKKIPEVWSQWLEKDPVNFLPQRLDNLKKLSGIYLDVGFKDNFHLQYGARQISQLLKENKIDHSYTEFDGNHFEIGERRIEVWKWLATQWRV
ncbi:MAG: alpha/beta hydrolase [Bdellovibrio sp.]